MIVRLLLLLLLLLLMVLMMMIGHSGGRRTGWMYHRLRLLLTRDVTLLLLRLLRLLLLLLLQVMMMVELMVLMVLMYLSRLYRGSSRWCDGETSTTAMHRRKRWRSLNHRRCSTSNPQSILAVTLAIRLPNVAASVPCIHSLQLMVAIEGVRYGTSLVGVTDR
uniref:Putativedisintegrin and metalloproteinase with thrombospondin motifs 16 n=1 Tax=Anopheles braziliensis TaxID=58242 RepID=A0A2M3Z7A4_9DIPT